MHVQRQRPGRGPASRYRAREGDEVNPLPTIAGTAFSKLPRGAVALLGEIDQVGFKVATAAHRTGVPYRKLYNGRVLSGDELARIRGVIADLRENAK